MTHPVISICMPVYKPKAEHLAAAVASALRQTERRWALQIREDPSDTDTRSVVEPLLGDPRITFVRNPARLGIGGNWNACLRDATAPYVQYLFQDDVWDDRYLERTLAALEGHPHAGLCAVPHRYAFEGRVPEGGVYDEVQAARAERMPEGVHAGKEFLLRWMENGLHPNLVGEPSFVMIRRDIARSAGPFDERMPQFLDVEYWTRCLLRADLVVLAENGGDFRVHPDAASAQNQLSGSGLFDRFETMRRVGDALSGAERRRAQRAISAALAPMIRKFLRRRKERKAVSVRGGGALKAFAMRHPLLTLRSLLAALRD